MRGAMPVPPAPSGPTYSSEALYAPSSVPPTPHGLAPMAAGEQPRVPPAALLPTPQHLPQPSLVPAAAAGASTPGLLSSLASPYDRTQPPSTPSSSAVEDKVRTVESVVGLLIEELRGVKRDNELLRDEITSVRSQHQQTEAHILRIAETYHSAPVRAHSPRGTSSLSSSSSSSMVWVPPSSPTFGHNTGANGDPNTPEAQALIMRLMPFVAKYDVRARNAPFVLDDLKYVVRDAPACRPAPPPWLVQC